MANVRSLAQLRALLIDMEAELGLVDLSIIEKDVLYAVSEVLEGEPPAARSEAVRNHPLVASIPQATYHRALRSLVSKGYLSHAPNTKAGLYMMGTASQ